MQRAGIRSFSAALLCTVLANCSYERDRADNASSPRVDGMSGTGGSSGSAATSGAAGVAAISGMSGSGAASSGAGASSDGRSVAATGGSSGAAGGGTGAGQGGAAATGMAGSAGKAGQSGQTCRAHSVGLGVRDTIHVNGASVPSCFVGTDGSLALTYTPPEGTSCILSGFKDPPWRGCEFAGNQDLSEFVNGQGVIKVDVCIWGAPEGEINIWYQDAVTMARKNLVLLYSWEPRNLGCRHMLFRNDDSDGGDDCPARHGTDLTKCSLPAGAGGAAGAGGHAGDSGRRGEAGETTGDASTYADSTLQLLSERCDLAHLPAAGMAAPVTVTLRSFTFRPTACLCRTNDDCPFNQSCSRDAWPRVACCTCAEDCPGLCE